MKIRTKIIAIGMALAVVAAACGGDDEPAETPAPVTEAPAPAEPATPATPGTIVDVATEAGSFGTLLAAVEAAGLVDVLSGETQYTVFAPTDEAFAALPEGTLESLLNDIPALTDILLYHVVPGEVFAADVVGLESATTVEGSDIAISVDGGNVFLNGSAQVVTTDVAASNGVIHVIDQVILPPMEEAMTLGTIVEVASEAGAFGTLLTAVEAAGLAETLMGEGPFTVFAPTDEAFAALPEGTLESLLNDIPTLTDILLYHVVPGEVFAVDVVGLAAATSAQGSDIAISVDGGNVFLNDGAQVVTTDVAASNGVIHVIDQVILPPMEEAMTPGTIVDVATEAGSFGTLLAAVEAAGLVETLMGEGPFTVFAPTDEAFAKLPEGTVEALLDDIPALTEILLYHVVAGEVFAADVVGLESATSAQGADIAISVEGGNVFLNGESQVVATDIEASNGVIHVIDTVIVPPSA